MNRSSTKGSSVTTSPAVCFVYLLFCVLLFLGLFEVGLRLLGTYRTHVEASGAEFFSAYETFGFKHNWTRPPDTVRAVNYQEFSYTFNTNSIGLRDIEHTIEKPDSVKRIVLLGDSFIESFGSPDDSTITVLLQQYLNVDTSLRYHYQVLNGGVAGSDLYFGYQLLKTQLLKYKPDVVVLNLNGTDVNDYMVRGTFDRYADDGTIHFRESPVNIPLYRSSHVYRFWVHYIGGRTVDTFLTPEEEDLYRADFASDAEILLDSMQQLALASNFKFYWIKQPLPDDIKAGHLPGSITAIDRPNGIDLYGPVSAHVNNTTDLVYWPIDGHFTPKGYAYYTHLLKDSLQQAGAFQ